MKVALLEFTASILAEHEQNCLLHMQRTKPDTPRVVGRHPRGRTLFPKQWGWSWDHERRFPPSRAVEETNACFIVAHSGFATGLPREQLPLGAARCATRCSPRGAS